MKRVVLLVIDGWGIGAQEDAEKYGDQSAHTIGHVSEITMLKLPNFQKMGLGNIAKLPSIPHESAPIASYGKLRELSCGKDSITGHWELAGIVLEKAFPTYPNGFPTELIHSFCQEIGIETFCVMLHIQELMSSQIMVMSIYLRGYPYLYTSADSVFQIATHEDIVPIETLFLSGVNGQDIDC